MTARRLQRLQKLFSEIVATVAAANAERIGAWHQHLHTRSCNQSAAATVMCIGVDALSITWMILTQARWLKLRSSMMMKRLAHWSGSFIRLWQNWCARIDHVERLRRTFAK